MSQPVDPQRPLPAPLRGEAAVTFPLSQEQFTDFLRGMLGKPQTVSKVIRGTFEISRTDVESVYHLLDSRINQQNDARLIQFSAKTVYSDESSVTLGSLDEFMTYNEVRPVVSKSVHLNFQYLIKFQDKQHPERQEVDVSFVSSGDRPTRIGGEDLPYVFITGLEGYFQFTIKYTARTWATDMESLLSNHLSGLLKDRPKVKDFLRKHDAGVSLVAGAVVFVSVVLGTLLTTNAVSHRIVEQLRATADALPSRSLEQLALRIDQLTDITVSGFWPRRYFYVFLFGILALVLAVVVATWSSSALERQDPSHVLLTNEASKKRDRDLKHTGRKWVSFVLSLVTSFVVSIAANFAFYYLMR